MRDKMRTEQELRDEIKRLEAEYKKDYEERTGNDGSSKSIKAKIAVLNWVLGERS